MNLRHFTTGTVLLGVLALLCSVWWSESENDLQVLPTTTTEIPTSIPSADQFPDRRHIHSECASCPDVVLEARKRGVDEYVDHEQQDLDCYGLLREAAEAGVPNPDTSHLGGCSGKTPLHLAETPEQVRNLLDSGANINARDQYGKTALYRQAVIGTLAPTEEKLAIVELLLDSGADVFVESEHGETAWEEAKKLNFNASMQLQWHQRVEAESRDQGVSVAEYLDANPAQKEIGDSWANRHLVSAKIEDALLRAVRNGGE